MFELRHEASAHVSPLDQEVRDESHAADHVSQSDFAIFASNRLSAFLKHSNVVEMKGNDSTESPREERFL